MPKRHQQWGPGDVFLVPMFDDLSVVGQIVGQEKSVLNSVTCAFSDIRVPNDFQPDSIQLSAEKIFSVLFVTRDQLDKGVWRVIGRRDIALPQNLYPYEELRSVGFVGARVIGSGIIIRFLSAYYGLSFWDNWHDPNYLDKLLLSPEKKPKKVLTKKMAD